MPVGYSLARSIVAFVRSQCIREFVLNRHQIQRPGGFVIACTHLSHLEPALISCHTRRQIHWVSRIEFFRVRWFRPILMMADALCVNRQGLSVSAMRRAIQLTRAGRIVGIFPEGGRVNINQSVLRGGPIKRGACLIALHAGVPIVPAVALNVHSLTRISPWLPAKRGRVWIAYGKPIEPVPIDRRTRRASRIAMGEQLRQAFVELDRELRARASLSNDVA